MSLEDKYDRHSSYNGSPDSLQREKNRLYESHDDGYDRMNRDSLASAPDDYQLQNVTNSYIASQPYNPAPEAPKKRVLDERVYVPAKLEST